jgi:hypothetical protein
MSSGMHVPKSHLISCESRAITRVHVLFSPETPELVFRKTEEQGPKIRREVEKRISITALSHSYHQFQPSYIDYLAVGIITYLIVDFCVSPRKRGLMDEVGQATLSAPVGLYLSICELP